MRQLQATGCLSPIATLFYGILGVLILSQFGGQIVNYAISTNWQQTSGTVISSTIEDASDTSGERYVGRIIYTYEFDGTSYEGNRVNFFRNIYVRNQDDVAQTLAPYPVGASVSPYINPNDPTQSVLDRSVSGAIWGLVSLGGLLVLLSVGLAVRYVSAPKPTD